MTLKEAKQQYPREWIAFRVEKEGKHIDDARGQVLDHERDRREIHRRLRQQRVKEVYLILLGL